MLEPHRIAGNDRANKRLETMLTRQDIEAWLKRGVEFSDMKFNFVDYYVQNLLKSEFGYLLRESLEEYRIRGISEGLAVIYVIEKVTKFQEVVAEELLGKTFRSNGSRMIFAIKFLSNYQGVFFARIFTTFSALVEPESAVRDCHVFNGFYIPNRHSTLVRDGKVLLAHGLIAMQDPLVFNQKSFFNSFQALGMAGLRYSDGNCQIITRRPDVIERLFGNLINANDKSMVEALSLVDDPIIERVFDRLGGAVL